MANRYTRDELAIRALDQSQAVNLINHDFPGGVIANDAFSIQWLQDVIDFWYHILPFSATVVNTPFNLVAQQQDYTLPSNFILDVRNGLIVQDTNDSNSKSRKLRIPLQKWINRDLHYQGSAETTTRFYTILGNVLKVTPIPTEARVGSLWYYKLPAALQSNDVPAFPNDYTIIEYIRIRAREWVGAYDPGTAQKFCDKLVEKMKASGLMNEPEDDEIPFDPLVHTQGGYKANYAWMGPR